MLAMRGDSVSLGAMGVRGARRAYQAHTPAANTPGAVRMAEQAPDLGFINLRDRAQAGDRKAFNQLFRNVGRVLKRRASLRIERLVRAKLAESDVIQDALFIAWKRFAEFHGENDHDLLAWLSAICNYVKRNAQRHFHAGKCDVAREVALVDTPPPSI